MSSRRIPTARPGLEALEPRQLFAGSIDTTFGTGGAFTTEFSAFDFGRAVLTQPDRHTARVDVAQSGGRGGRSDRPR